jgi:hypothetical protein
MNTLARIDAAIAAAVSVPQKRRLQQQREEIVRRTRVKREHMDVRKFRIGQVTWSPPKYAEGTDGLLAAYMCAVAWCGTIPSNQEVRLIVRIVDDAELAVIDNGNAQLRHV